MKSKWQVGKKQPRTILCGLCFLQNKAADKYFFACHPKCFSCSRTGAIRDVLVFPELRKIGLEINFWGLSAFDENTEPQL